MSTNILTRAALGSLASLGDLYDARRDDFCGISIFKKAIPSGARAINDSHFSDIHLIHSDDFSDKVSKLDVNAELQVSVLAGLFRLEGSGRYLNDQKKSARTVKSSLVYNIKTKHESVNIYHEDLKDAFAIDAIESGVATHMVVGISWGANSIVSCVYENRENKDVTEIGGNLSAELKKISLSISGKANVDFTEGDRSTGVKFDVRMYGDVLSQNEELPTTFEGALELMRKLPTLVASSNEGRGKPLSYRLIPISLLKDYLNFAIKADTTLKSLEEASLIRVVQLFDQMSKCQQQLNDFFQDAIDFKCCVLREDFLKISTLKDEMTIQETAFRSELSTVLTNVRSGKMEVSHLEELIKKFQSSDVSPQKVFATLATWRDLIEKINFARTLIQNGAKYIGFGGSLDNELLQNFKSKAFVFYFQKQAGKEDNNWIGNRQLFFRELKNQNNDNKYYAVDCDFHSQNVLSNNRSSCVQIIQECQVLNEDLLAQHRKSGQTPFAQASTARITKRILHKPSKRVPLTISCTGNNCNPVKTYEWICQKCWEKLEYGFDQNCYCNCGVTPAILLEFKCTDPRHGLSFEKHDDEYLLQILSTLRPFKEVNVLLLGEPGNEKSDWINGLQSWLRHESFGDAEKGGMCHLTPSKLTVYNESSGDPAPDLYPLHVGSTTVRLIDTSHIIDMIPGPGHSGHNEQKNLKSFLNKSNLDEIHGICVFLNPNNPKLNAIFQHCANELFPHLNTDAGKNVIFCFTTSSNQTFQRPAETMSTLRKLISEKALLEIVISHDTVYCFDSKSSQCLNYLPGQVQLSEEQRKMMTRNWDENVDETKRMLEHIRGLEPYLPKWSPPKYLDPLRKLLLQLSQNVEYIYENIANSKALLEDKKKLKRDFAASLMEIMQMECEFERMLRICARFIYTIESNSKKTPASAGVDTMAEYIDNLIENRKATHNSSDCHLHQLYNIQRSYRIMRQMLRNEYLNTTGVDSQELEMSIYELQSCKYFQSASESDLCSELLNLLKMS